MLLERYYDDTLAQASYLIGCQETGEAIVVDPNRDVLRYLNAASKNRMRIVGVTETHIHADYLSGSRDLARAAKATLILSGHGDDTWSYGFASADGARLVRDGDSISIGNVRLDVRHTPGHTPEHIAFLVTDLATGERPLGMLSGDFVFVGDVGRPDLLERAAKVAGTMEGAARDLFASLQRLQDLPDYLQIWPGHGAGSACGKALGAVPQTTLGYERLYNPAFQQKTEADFVRWVLADQPEAPPYFAMMKRLNRDGPPGMPATEPRQLDARGVETALDRDDWVVDLRAPVAFAQRHLPGTINIPGASKSFVTYAGTVLTYDRPIVLIAKSVEQAYVAIRQLALIGFDNIGGWAALDVLQQVQSAGRHLASILTIDPPTLAERLQGNGPRVIDVRGTSEWKEGHLPKATHIYLGDLADRTADIRRDEPIVVHCESGTRSSIAASLLMARGFSDVTNFDGGFAAWQRAGLPVVTE
jgi:hydroxyacylglutathione hydrolase